MSERTFEDPLSAAVHFLFGEGGVWVGGDVPSSLYSRNGGGVCAFSTAVALSLSPKDLVPEHMPTYTIIGFEKDGFERFTNVASADEPARAAAKALQDQFIKTKGRRPPDTDALAQLENETGLFVVGIIEGEHDNLDELVDHYEQW